jgi:hypothetical protein
MTKYVGIHLGVLCTYCTHTPKMREREREKAKKKERERAREKRSKYGGDDVTTTTTIVTAMKRQREMIGEERHLPLPDRHVTRVVKTSPRTFGFVICTRAANFIASPAPASDREALPLDLTHPPDTINNPPPSSQLPPHSHTPKK